MYSQFDGNAAFSGGGFMPSQATQTTENGVFPSKNRDSQGLLPLTVKQISEAVLPNEEKSTFSVNGVEINNVKLVGMVFNKTERVTEVTFSLDDGTGRIDCHRWMNENIDTKEMEEIQDGMYVRLHGHLKGYHGKKQLVAFSVRPVTDFNEIAYHFIECIYVHVHNSRLQAQGGVQPSTMNAPVQNGLTGYQAPGANQFSGQYSFDGLKDLDQKILNYLQQPANLALEKGTSSEELMQQFKVPLKKIMDSIKSLEEEGAIYSTIDEFHFKSTING